MKRIPLCTLLLFTTVILGGLLPTSTPAEAHDWLGDCVVDFDNTFALTYIYGQARGNFGYPTGIDNSGELQPCNATHQACWTYRHRCFGNYINVDDMTYGHIHLVFDSPSLLTPVLSIPATGPAQALDGTSATTASPPIGFMNREPSARMGRITGSRSGWRIG